MITQQVLDQFVGAFNPTPEEIAAHPIELFNLSGCHPAVCEQVRQRYSA